MSDSSITAKDAAGSTVTLDTQDVGGSGQHQQTVVVGNGIDAGRVAYVDPYLGLYVTETRAATATILSPVTSTTASVTIVGTNMSRRGLIVKNDSTNGTLFLAHDGSTASTNNYSLDLEPGDRYEMWPIVTGRITGIWNVASGVARVTELT